MANATDVVLSGTVRRTDEFIVAPLAAPGSSDVYYWPGAAIGVNASGYLQKFDDTAALTFFGIAVPGEGKFKNPAGANAGDYKLMVQQPFRFELAVSGVAQSDIGRRVYAVDDQTGTLDPTTTTYDNVYGIVVGLVASGIALVQPEFGGVQAVSRNPVQVATAAGAIQLKNSTVVINNAAITALTLANPTAGAQDGLEVTVISATAYAHTVTFGTNSPNGLSTHLATFGGAKGDGLVVVAYGGVWYIKSKTNITLS